MVSDGYVSFIVDLDLDTAVGSGPVVTELVIVTVNLAEEAEPFILDGINALNSDGEKEKKGGSIEISKRW